MEGYQWNISKILMDILKNEYSVSYACFSEVIQCSEVTTLHWRNGSRKLQPSSIKNICEKIPAFLSKDKKDLALLNRLKKEFKPISGMVQNTIESRENLKDLLEYLYDGFETDLAKDKLYDLIHNPDSNSQLRKIILEKFKTNIKRTPIFQIEEMKGHEKNLLLQKEYKWNLNLNHCIILKFKTKERQRTYNVLIDYNYNREEHENIGDIKEAKDALKTYGVDMILLFSNTKIPKDEVYFYMKCSIYIEEIDLQELSMIKVSKDYIYAIEDKEKEIPANQYSDLVLGRLNKYYSTIFKNILFSPSRELTNKQQENYIFWDSKYIMRHHINFQTERINELLLTNKNECFGNALAIGFQSFPSILRLAERFEHIYLLDNSTSSITFYENQLENNNPELAKKIHFFTFTSVLFEFISNRFHLYNSIDFILLGTGEGSFIKKLPTYYLMCNSWLKQGGIMYISFFNREFPYEFVDKATIEENSEFIPKDNEKQATAVVANSTERYNLFCETYDCNEVKDIAERYFKVKRLFSYPLGCALQSTHRSRLQNILKEYDKEYSKNGFYQRNFSNSRGYYVDAALEKYNGNKLLVEDLTGKKLEKIDFNEKHKEDYLKTILLTDIRTSVKNIWNLNQPIEIYAVILPTGKRLPETDKKEVFILLKRLRFLTIAEINYLGLEYKNISPFLFNSDHSIKLTLYYDYSISKKKDKYYYIGEGTSYQKCYKIKTDYLLSLLEEHGYEQTKIL